VSLSDREVLHTETMDRELDRLAEKRSGVEPDADELEPTYAESVRRFNERARQERRAEWIAFHTGMAQLHSRLSDEHRSKAARLDPSPNGRNVSDAEEV
jgi:hypothetical protein